jgi:F-type H+-transporting ATPase subunit epsilon
MSGENRIHLTVLLPGSTLLEDEASEVILRTVAGPFGILPRHIDFATSLVSGIFEYRTADGERRYVAADGGSAVKTGRDVLVATPDGVTGPDAGVLRTAMRERFALASEAEERAHDAMKRLEASLTHGLLELGREERSA